VNNASFLTDIALKKVNKNTRMNSFQTNFCFPSALHLELCYLPAPKVLGNILSLSLSLFLCPLRVLFRVPPNTEALVILEIQSVLQTRNAVVGKLRSTKVIKRLCLSDFGWKAFKKLEIRGISSLWESALR